MDPFSLDSKLSEDYKHSLVSEWHDLSQEEKARFERKAGRSVDPAVATFRPDSNFGSISEKLEEMMEDYLKDDGEFCLRLKRKNERQKQEEKEKFKVLDATRQCNLGQTLRDVPFRKWCT